MTNFNWLNEDNGEIKVSRNQPPGNYLLVDSVNTGYIDQYGQTLFVPSTLDGVMDWWIDMGHFATHINRVSKTTIMISGAGEYSKSWLRRYFFVRDIDGDLVVSYT